MEATHQIPRLGSAATIREVLSVLLRKAETPSKLPHKTNAGGETRAEVCDRLLVEFYDRAQLVADSTEAKPTKEVVTQFVYSITDYGMARTEAYLDRKRKRGDDGEAAPLLLIQWRLLRGLMFQVVGDGIKAGVAKEDSKAARIFFSPRFLTMLDMLVRAETEERMGDGKAGRLKWSFNHSLDLARCLKDSLEFVCLSLLHTDTLQDDVAAEMVFCVYKDAACLNFLGTILKLQHILAICLTRLQDQGSESCRAPLAKTLRRTMLTLMLDKTLLSSTRMGNAIEMRILQAHVAQHQLMEAVRDRTHGGVVDDELLRMGLSLKRVQQWEADIEDMSIVQAREHVCDEGDSCHNPSCVTLEGSNETTMVTRQCGACRGVRYCSVECLKRDRPGHRRACGETCAHVPTPDPA